MQSPKRDLADIALPRALVFTAAMTCGVFAAIVMQLQLSRAGLDVASLFQNLFSARLLQLRAAGPWWAIAGTAFIVGGVVAAVLSRFPLPWRRFRLLRWAVGGAIVLGLAHVAHGAGARPGISLTAGAAAGLAVLCVAAIMGLFGAYFAARR